MTGLHTPAAIACLVCAPACSASYVTSKATPGALDRVAKSAASEYTVTRIDDNTLHLRDTWVISSILAMGWYSSHIYLHHDPESGFLQLQYFLRANALMCLWLPIYYDAEPK